MNLSTLKPAKGSRKQKKRVGRGPGSGNGTTAGAGNKGHQARSGYTSSFKEGGQMPIYRRLPKFGFTKPNRVDVSTVSLGQISEWMKKGKLTNEITLEALSKAGISAKRNPVKILSDGDLTEAITVTAHAFSEAAKEKIEKAGGKIIVAERTLEEAGMMTSLAPDVALMTPKKNLEEVKKAAKAARKAAAKKAKK
jgi:large subunit ribosomal protein L15